MTTKHVVADDLYGKFCRRVWELERRVLEGTIPLHDALDILQGILEGKLPSAVPASLGVGLEKALREITEMRKKGNSLTQHSLDVSTFRHLEVGRYYFTKYHCGKNALQVKVFYLRPSGKVSRGADEILCTTCWKHESSSGGGLT